MKAVLLLATAVLYVWAARWVWECFMGPYLKQYSYNWPWWSMPLYVTLVTGGIAVGYAAVRLLDHLEEL